MSKIKDLLFDIVEDVRLGHLNFHQIAEKHDVTYFDVLDTSKEMMYCYDDIALNQNYGD